MSATIGYATGKTAHAISAESFGFEYAWLEGVMKARLAAFAAVAGEWDHLNIWTSGRLFGEVGEYRWRFMDNQTLHAVLILDEGEVPEGFTGIKPLISGVEQRLILWGEWVDPNEDTEANVDGGPVFYAGEIPDPQTYTIDADTETLRIAAQEGKTPRLVVRRYNLASADINMPPGDFVRCVGFEIYKEASHGSDQSV